eukprot:CAMPEP_0198344786 /NCGR_PEP_ID=MMETSP1450-20131203/69765_1 /TAXON_ID=753684 ORGANISM="Madagascaria erythrocladiodes, Strain CCMP3234" /NCGR_SAMPLE_ID=MMETSP1450 /ASSEMBLY_ACC=CAM_ASM_001115 /LENGTH=92 /DNA_ID=CAMNT_0044050071 /DNA_START=42 /DNA_END=317 /DNA_ORIENTATION=+
MIVVGCVCVRARLRRRAAQRRRARGVGRHAAQQRVQDDEDVRRSRHVLVHVLAALLALVLAAVDLRQLTEAARARTRLARLVFIDDDDDGDA